MDSGQAQVARFTKRGHVWERILSTSLHWASSGGGLVDTLDLILDSGWPEAMSQGKPGGHCEPRGTWETKPGGQLLTRGRKLTVEADFNDQGAL